MNQRALSQSAPESIRVNLLESESIRVQAVGRLRSVSRRPGPRPRRAHGRWTSGHNFDSSGRHYDSGRDFGSGRGRGGPTAAAAVTSTLLHSLRVKNALPFKLG